MRESRHTYCRTTLNYESENGPVPVETDILNGRPTMEELTWEQCGFELIQHTSDVSNWWDEGEIERIHYDEIETLARRLTSCDHVLFYPAIHRSEAMAKKHPDFAPIQFVHSDYTESYGEMIKDPDHPYRAIFEPFMARAGISNKNIRDATRVVTLQFWRNIGPALPDFPIGFCDCRTVAREDLTPVLLTEYGGVRTEFEVFAVSRPNFEGQHRWYTFPALTEDEVVVFRTYDSARVECGKAFWTLHSAFRDTSLSADAPARQSLELRAICLYQ
ncbi:MAG: CmcJ/NvfI family oxidoreductase [Pseudomonadales bacterium]